MSNSIPFSLMGGLRCLRVLLLAGLGLMLPAFCQLARAEEGRISEFDQARALQAMKDPDAKLRALAYRACRKLGEVGREPYRSLLGRALAFHQEKIESSIELASEEANRFSGTVEKLRQQRNFALDFTLADIAKESAVLVDLRRAHGDTALWLKEANAQHGRAIASMGVVNSSATAIDEIYRELAYCAGKAVTISPHTFHSVLSRHSTLASNLHDRLEELSAFQQEVQQFQNVKTHNGKQTWATTEMRAFADIVNEWRHVLGLPALRLEQRLSYACASHAREMAEMGYFAHRSPVLENSTPERRAANAKYRGTFVGENIYFYATPQGARAAFDAWWQSDGHRFVMFDPKSDQLGLSDRPTTHWTMMTGAAPVRTEVRSAQVD